MRALNNSPIQILRNVAEPNGSYCVRRMGCYRRHVPARAGRRLAASSLGHSSSRIRRAGDGACLPLPAIYCRRRAPSLFKPMLLLTLTSLQAAEYPHFIPWEQITGVRLENRLGHVRRMRTHGGLGAPPARADEQGSSLRLHLLDDGRRLYRRRNELRFALTQQRRDAQVIAIVAGHLWREKRRGAGGACRASYLPRPGSALQLRNHSITNLARRKALGAAPWRYPPVRAPAFHGANRGGVEQRQLPSLATRE